jgi:hypothetical protein
MVVLAAGMLPPSRAAAEAPDPKPDLGANAAMKYWQAFAALPALDKNQEMLVNEWSKVPLDTRVLALIDRSRNCLLYLHRGARLPQCDWSLDSEDGVGLMLSHCPRSLTLARLAALRARYEFEQGRLKEGWADVTSMLTLGRHVGMGPQFVVRWVDYKIETMAIEAAAPYLPELRTILAEDASNVVDKLPAGPTLAQMVLSEKEIGLRWLIQQMTQAERHKAGAWRDVWKTLFDVPESQHRDLVHSVQTFDQAVDFLQDLLPLYDQLATMVALPWRDFDRQHAEFVKKAKARKPHSDFVLPADANPLTSFILPPMDAIMARERRYHAQVAMFKAALGVVQRGPDTLKHSIDPFGNGPFEYQVLENGFELKSSLRYQEKPVTLTIGRKKER